MDGAYEGFWAFRTASLRGESVSTSIGRVGEERLSALDGVGDVVDVLGGEAGHADAAVGDQVDVVLLGQDLDLVGCARET